ncbi:hypothetical protein, partial [Streptococcus devriesei]
SHKLLSNDGLGAFHYKSYEAFCVFKKLYNIQSGVTHYRYYRAFFLKRAGFFLKFGGRSDCNVKLFSRQKCGKGCFFIVFMYEKSYIV